MTTEERLRERERRGLCLTCDYEPTQCFEAVGRRGVPWRRVPLTVPGKVEAGVCLMCNPLQGRDEDVPKTAKKNKNKSGPSRRRWSTPPRLRTRNEARATQSSTTENVAGVLDQQQQSSNISAVIAEWEEQGAIVADVTPAPSEYAPIEQEDDLVYVNAPVFIEGDDDDDKQKGGAEKPEGRASSSSIRTPQQEQQQQAPEPRQEQDVPSVPLTNLKEAVHSMLASDDSEMDLIAIDAIVGAMDAHAADKHIQAYGVEQLLPLVQKGNTNKDALLCSAALASILGAMSSLLSDPLVQQTGCGILWSLAVNPNNRQFISETGACARIVDALTSHPSSHLVARNALGAARSLSTHQHAKTKFKSVDAPHIIADVMSIQIPNEEIQALGCTVLSNLAVNVSTGRVSTVSSFEIDAILSALDYHKTSLKVQKEGCFALKNLSFSDLNIRTMRTNSRFEEISPLLESATSHFPQDCANYVTFLLDRLKNPQTTTKSENMEVKTRIPSFPNSVFHAGTTNSFSSEDHACAAAIDLTQKLSAPSSFQSSSEVLSALASLMLDHGQSSHVQISALKSLEEVIGGPTSQNHHYDAISSNSEILTAIMSALVHHGPRSVEVAACGCCVLHEVARGGGEMCRANIVRHRILNTSGYVCGNDDGVNSHTTCIGALVVALRSHYGVEKVQVPAIEAISLLSEVDPATDFQDPRKKGFIRTMALVTSSETSSRSIKKAGRDALQLIRMRSLSKSQFMNDSHPSMDPNLGDVNALLDSFNQ